MYETFLFKQPTSFFEKLLSKYLCSFRGTFSASGSFECSVCLKSGNTRLRMPSTAQKMLVTSFLRIWSHLLKRSLMENFIFCAVQRFLSFAHKLKLIAFRWKKKLVKVDQFFSGDQYFSPINNFAQLKLTPTKNFFVSYFFSWIKTK